MNGPHVSRRDYEAAADFRRKHGEREMMPDTEIEIDGIKIPVKCLHYEDVTKTLVGKPLWGNEKHVSFGCLCSRHGLIVWIFVPPPYENLWGEVGT